MIMQLCKYLDDATPNLSLGLNLFCGYFPVDADPDNALCIMQKTGGRPDFFVPDRVTETFQLFSRDREFYAAKERLELALSFLHGKAQISLPVISGDTSQYIIDSATTVNGPAYFGADERQRHIFIGNILIRYAKPN